MKLARRTYIVLGAVLAGALVVMGATLINRGTPVTLPTGTIIPVTLDQGLSSSGSRSGQSFEATVAAPVEVQGKPVIPAGARARGHVLEAVPSGHLEGAARLSLALESVEVNGDWYDLQTTAASRRGRGHAGHNWKWIGGGAGFGALLGGLAGGGKGILIGAPIGAGAGTFAAYMTGKKDIYLPPEARVSFRLVEPVTVNTKS